LGASHDPPTTWVEIFSIDRAIMATSMGISLKQFWPYAPYQEMIVTLTYAARAALLFFPIAALTCLICGVPVSLRKFALLAGLFLLPFLVLMSGVFPYPDSVSPAQLAGYQVRMLPVLALLTVVMAEPHLRRTPRLPVVLTLLLMALAMGLYALIGLMPDVQKRNATETMIQAGLIGYIFLLALFTRLRPILPLPGGRPPKTTQSRHEAPQAPGEEKTPRTLLARYWKPGLLVLILIAALVLSGVFLNFGGPELPAPPPCQCIF